eukprot:4727744-Prymnesium_polylepis.1
MSAARSSYQRVLQAAHKLRLIQLAAADDVGAADVLPPGACADASDEEANALLREALALPEHTRYARAVEEYAFGSSGALGAGPAFVAWLARVKLSSRGRATFEAAAASVREARVSSAGHVFEWQTQAAFTRWRAPLFQLARRCLGVGSGRTLKLDTLVDLIDLAHVS